MLSNAALFAVLVLSAAGVAAAGAATGGDAFPESRLITPAQGALLNSWANSSNTWKLCYTTFTMDKTSPAVYHKNCDKYKPTVTVVHNTGGRPGRCKGVWNYQDQLDFPSPCSPIGSNCSDPVGGPGQTGDCPSGGHGYGQCAGQCSFDDSACPVAGPPCGPTNPGNFTFGGYADATWSGDRVSKGTPACFIFGLGPDEPVHYGQSSQWASTSDWPAWDQLWIGGTSQFNPTGAGGPPGTYGSCSGPHPLQCGGDGNWGETELEVWRPVCAADAHCGAHETCDAKDGSCVCAVGWSGPGCGTCDKSRFCSGRGSCVLPSPSNTPACHCDAGYSGADCSTFAGSPLFPETRIVSPEWGTALDGWMPAGIPAGQVWKLCYSSDTMDKTTAEFHKRCDQYNKTVSVAKNTLGFDTSGTEGRPDNMKGATFGGFADESWSASGCGPGSWGGGCYKGTSANFIFGLGIPGGKPDGSDGTFRYPAKRGATNHFQLAGNDYWPVWGTVSVPDLFMGYKGAPGGETAGCWANARGGRTYEPVSEKGEYPVPPPLCGSLSMGVWGETELEVWRMATAEELRAASGP